MILSLNEEDKEFLHTMWKTILPHQYKELSERTYRQVFAYFTSILILGFFTLLLLLLPQMIFLPSYVANNSAKIDDLSIAIAVHTKEPFILTERIPFAVIDTSGNISNSTRAKILLTDQYLRVDTLGSPTKINITEFQTISKNPELLQKSILFLIVLLAPGVILFGFILSFIKYFIIASLIGGVTFLITRLLRFHIEFKKTYLMSFYASTLMILLDLVTFPLGLNVFLFPIKFFGVFINILSLAAYLTLYILAIFLVGHLEMRY